MDQPIKSPCPACNQETKQFVLGMDVAHGRDDLTGTGDYMDWNKTCQMLKCCGCYRITLRIESWDSMDTDENGNALHTK